MDLISVIVPVYNVELYINKCLNSIINQTYKNIEVLLIDDGSNDKSGIICDEYTKLDTRIHTYHKTNGGLSDARNYGIEKSSGKFICFIDSDDYIEETMLEDLYNGIVDNNCDLSIINKVREYENGYSVKENTYKNNEIITPEKAIEYLLLSDPSACNKMFKKELFTGISFPTKKLYEDILTIPYVIDKANSIYVISKIGYHYIQRNNSIVNHRFNVRKMDYYYNTKKVTLYINNKYNKLVDASNMNIMLVITTLLFEIYQERKKYHEEYNLLKKELRAYKKGLRFNKCMCFSKKVMVLLHCYNMDIIVIVLKKIRNKIRKG